MLQAARIEIKRLRHHVVDEHLRTPRKLAEVIRRGAEQAQVVFESKSPLGGAERIEVARCEQERGSLLLFGLLPIVLPGCDVSECTDCKSEKVRWGSSELDPVLCWYQVLVHLGCRLRCA